MYKYIISEKYLNLDWNQDLNLCHLWNQELDWMIEDFHFVFKGVEVVYLAFLWSVPVSDEWHFHVFFFAFLDLDQDLSWFPCFREEKGVILIESE